MYDHALIIVLKLRDWATAWICNETGTDKMRQGNLASFGLDFVYAIRKKMISDPDRWSWIWIKSIDYNVHKVTCHFEGDNFGFGFIVGFESRGGYVCSNGCLFRVDIWETNFLSFKIIYSLLLRLSLFTATIFIVPILLSTEEGFKPRLVVS